MNLKSFLESKATPSSRTQPSPLPRAWNFNLVPTRTAGRSKSLLSRWRKPSRWSLRRRKSLRRPRPPSPTLPPVTPPICPNCKNRPAAPNPATGQYFDHCSKSCATQARNPGPSQRGGQVHALCEQCKRRPRFRKGAKVYPYCGQACAKLANNGPTPANPPVNPPIPRDAHLAPLQPASSGRICQIPGCTLPVFVHQSGTPSNYCMVNHNDWGEQGCISCRAAPTSNASALCQPCYDDALSKAPAIIEVPEDHENFKSVEKQFKQTWRHRTTCPEVRVVYKIIVTEASLKQYQQYQDSVEGRGNFMAMGKSRGNEHRRWHGTRRKCTLGDPGNKTFCTDPECSLCCIIQTSFDLKFFKAATGWGRFGHGIYTSSTSSKSNDYSRNMGVDSEWKALLLNKVVVGNGKKLIQDDTSLTEPPPGYDSVLAEVVPGGALNYDELVVYKNEAVRPSYLVMYESP